MRVASITASASVTAVLGLAAYAALSRGSQFFGPTLIAGHDPDHLALTYDDGPNPAATPPLLEILASHNVRATFFLVGRHVRLYPALTREIHASGHLIGNHTMTHPWLAWQSNVRIRAELEGCNHAIEDVTGAPVRFFRPPHGARRPYVLTVARELGLTTVQWNIIVQDWQTADPGLLLTRIERGIGRNRRKGRASNILLHDGDGSQGGGIAYADRLATVEATRRLLALYQGSRQQFVTPEAWLDHYGS